MTHKNLTITVDGGASGCRFAAFDANGALHASTESGPASLSLGAKQAWNNIKSGLALLAKELGEPDDWLPHQLWMGLAGSLQRERYEQFMRLIPTTVTAVVVPDGHAQLIGATKGRAGICLALGTGSVIHWLDNSGNFGKAGGWGYPIGDEASGAWLGTQLINQYLWFLDASTKNSTTPKLFTELEQHIGKSVSDIQAWSTNTSSTRIASLAPIVVKHADEDDALANRLLDKGANYCQQLINLAPDDLPIYLVGGLANAYASRLKTYYVNRCQPTHGNALDGLFTLSRNELLIKHE